MKVIDHSDFIAKLGVLIECLAHFEPAGDWSRDALLVAYQRDRYCLSLKQAKQLEQTLEDHLERVTAKVEQIELFGGTRE